jgi:hypothetical protein
MTDQEFLDHLGERVGECAHFRFTTGEANKLYLLAGLGPVESLVREKFFHVRSGLIKPVLALALAQLQRVVEADLVHAYRCPVCEGSGKPEQDVYSTPSGPCSHCDGEGWWDYAPCERTYGPYEYFEGTPEEVKAWLVGPVPEADMVALVDWRQGSADQWGEELLGKVLHHFENRQIPEEHQAAHAKFMQHPHQLRLLRKILRQLGAY